MTTTPTTPEVAPAGTRQERTIDQMLDTEGFIGWLEKAKGAEGLVNNMNEANRGRIETFFTLWEASKAVTEKVQGIYNSKLAGEQFDALTAEDAEQITALLGNESPARVLERQKDIERLEGFPAQIQSAEAEIASLSAGAEGTPESVEELQQSIKAAKEKRKPLDERLKGLPKDKVKLKLRERVDYYANKLLRTDFEKEIAILKKKTDPRSEAEAAKLEKLKLFSDQSRAEEWKAQVALLDARIAEWDTELKSKEAGQARLASLPAEVAKLKAETAQLRKKICETLPINAAVHQRISEKIHEKLLVAGTADYDWELDDAVRETRRLEELARGGGGNYLDDLGAFHGDKKVIPLAEYKKSIDAKFEKVVEKMLADTMQGIAENTLRTTFEAQLQEFVDKAQKGFGFKSVAQSKAFVITLLEAQKAEAAKTLGTGKTVNLSRLIAKLKAS